ncbi:MAG TPA: ion channel [Thermohalobaculum sp.]|nr:ion channel [Thermohalobaculum sp.]
MITLDRLRELYEGGSDEAERFRYGLVIFDLTTISFVIVSSFLEWRSVFLVLDIVFGVVIIADLSARFAIARRRLRFLVSPVTLADIAATAAFLAPMLGDEYGFLRVLRMLRLLHTYQLVARLRADFRIFRENEQLIGAAVNLAVFIFVMTGLVYATQHDKNPDIGNYVDSLYFTVTALTTTGFGDITLPGTTGRMIAVAIMLFGVTLFLRLAQVLFRPAKVRQPCPNCGLLLHDPDAVHCKHCGEPIRIETKGEV